MNSTTILNEAVAYIQKLTPGFVPKLGTILGSGLSDLANQITDAVTIPFADIPGFPVIHTAGHPGRLILGKLESVPVVCLQGRAHLYEGYSATILKTLIRTIKLLGCSILVMTNSSGSLRPDVGPGELMLITDHINFQPGNPLVGPNEEEFGPRFLSMDEAYDHELRTRLISIAQKLNIRLAQGVYISTLGPIFETPAEIRAFRILGADAVGMSTVPEVIIARHCGLRVAVIAGITNLAAGMSNEILSHEHTLQHAELFKSNMKLLISGLMKDLENVI